MRHCTLTLYSLVPNPFQIKDAASVADDAYLTELWFDFRYVIGYCSFDASDGTWCPKHDGLPTMSLLATVHPANETTVIWESSKTQIQGYAANSPHPSFC